MTVLVVYSDTPHGRAALDRSVEEATLRHTDLVVLNAPADSGSDDVTRETALAAARRGVTFSAERHHDEREPVEHLIDAAGRPGVDLLVLGLPRRSPVGKLLLGSVEQHVLLEADSPVLAVKGS